MTYDVSDLLKLSVVKYLDIVGEDTVLKKVATPILPDVTRDHPSRAPCNDKAGAVTCTWCGHVSSWLIPIQGLVIRPGRQT